MTAILWFQYIKKGCDRKYERFNITALVAAILWFQSRQYYRPTDTNKAKTETN
ncbi:hypothetical protein [Anabaena lutea]|uniref:Uncharacterized protein n=1 Tax=Anabaena lutea FACHB-196 TaxID=2692881 RepID=A0ABR8FAH6_9NOST|nr:hypothetical protein [Anabaena lutea]MBD2567091.1 hypothetical protein [Anabaena lutea FACHB-196]